MDIIIVGWNSRLVVSAIIDISWVEFEAIIIISWLDFTTTGSSWLDFHNYQVAINWVTANWESSQRKSGERSENQSNPSSATTAPPLAGGAPGGPARRPKKTPPRRSNLTLFYTQSVIKPNKPSRKHGNPRKLDSWHRCS